MAHNEDEGRLEQCLVAISRAVQVTITNMRKRRNVESHASSDELLTNPALDVNIHTFTLDNDEAAAMENLKVNVEGIVNERLPRLSREARNFLLDFLYAFDYDAQRRRFQTPFNTGMLDSFASDVKGTIQFIGALQAAWNGNLDIVKTFLDRLPKMKDRSGLWGTTLLYSAARNGHLTIVKYLICTAQCSVNAQNQQHVVRLLPNVTNTVDDFIANPTAGSTALHGACYYEHIEVVKFLIDRDADYFLTNHAVETPLMNVAKGLEVEKFFREFLILGYSSTRQELPTKPIHAETSRQVDRYWEYKPFSDDTWYRFSDPEANILQQALLVEDGREFKREIHLAPKKGVYNVSMVKFLRSGRGQDYAQNCAWVRCRGSSVLNFDCCELWQIMLIKHPAATATSTMEILSMPASYNSRFTVQLNTWYQCDVRTNDLLARTMDIRKKKIIVNLPLLSMERFLVDLHNFTVVSESGNIAGYVRWIPKLIPRNARHINQIIDIDQYETLAQLDPVPLTTARFRQLSDKSDASSGIGQEPMNNDDDVHENADHLYNSIASAEAANAPEPVNSSIVRAQSVNDILRGSPAAGLVASPIGSAEDDRVRSIDEFVNESAPAIHRSQTSPVRERAVDSTNDQALASTNVRLARMKEENDELRCNLELQQAQLQTLMDSKSQQSDVHGQAMQELIDQISVMNAERTRAEEKQTRLEEVIRNIQSIAYADIAKEVVHDFLAPKYHLVITRLQEAMPHVDPSLAERIPKMLFHEREGTYVVTVVGFQKHHVEFKAIMTRITALRNVLQPAKDFYRRELRRAIRALSKDVLAKVRPRTDVWNEYRKLFEKLLIGKADEYQKRFDENLLRKLQSLHEDCIRARLSHPWKDVRETTNAFIASNVFAQEIEPAKQNALKEFIEVNIKMQCVNLPGTPSAKSALVLQNYIEKTEREFLTNPIYRGDGLQHFELIPKLLERLMLYYSCFALQLPLYEFSEGLLDKIATNAVTTIATATGSGKSTLLPALLVAEGYDKVIVTQPRRLPCQLIARRVNQTMTTDIGASTEELAGWVVSGAGKSTESKVLYITDGLLKERLLYDKDFIGSHTRTNKSVVFFIDEVHERSVNIDLCLALLARLLSTRPELKSKMKVIISSATLDASVPTLFRRIPQVGLAEFEMPQMGTLHPVKTIARPNANILDVVQELCKKRKRHDQILCFVSSTAEVYQCVSLIGEISRGTIVADPLVQSQHSNVQQHNIEHGTVFFSTTVAETSLTFPCLKYVVDTGMINKPVYDVESGRTVLKEVRAAESTIKQRRGRLGRTQPGEYYALYTFHASDLKYPVPQICQSDLINLEFSLRKSPLQKGLEYMKQFLPDKPPQSAIDTTIEQLKKLRIIRDGPIDAFTTHGRALATLPDFGSLAMSKAVLAALVDYNCGRDLIYLSCILGVLNTTSIFKSIPQHLKSTDGDFMTLLNVMNVVLLIKQSVPKAQFDIARVCQEKGLGDIQHIVRQAVRRYDTLEKLFSLSSDYRGKAQVTTDKWENVARALLAGYSDNVFVSMRDLHNRNLHFERYNGQGGVAVLDLNSTLTRPKASAPVPLVLARDIRHSTAVRARAILSFLGEIKPEWMPHQLERQFALSTEESAHLNSNNRFEGARATFSDKITLRMDTNAIHLKGPAGPVLNAELHLRQQMVSELKFTLRELAKGTAHENFDRNLESVMRATRIFNPMVWRWQGEKQVRITINSDTATKRCEVSVEGRDSENKKVRNEFAAFINWLQVCAVIRHPNAGLSPRVLRPQMRKACREIEERIARVTDSKRTTIDRFNGTKGINASRETRMEVVAWIAVCKFDCTVEGGFVRDWIVGGQVARPKTPMASPKNWIQYQNGLPGLDKEVVPCDIDCHLPSHAYFDMDKFQDELYKYEISCTVCYDNWRYVLLLDENEPTGPFTMDLIEPHVALTHDRIDFDVNNLSLEKDYTHELGMRIDIAQKPYSIELESIVDNIRNKRFRVLRPEDNNLRLRIDKMVKVRGWTRVDQAISVLPSMHFKQNVILVPLPRSAVLYDEVVKRMATIDKVRIVSMEEIRNPALEETYEGMKKLIGKQCAKGNPNERELFHGTEGDGVAGIAEDGFDDRFFSTDGLYGRGAYFADNPVKSHSYTAVDPTIKARVMYYAKVLLGKSSVLTDPDDTLVAAPRNHHSVTGQHNPLTEYIVYRYGQALPYLKIVYTV